MPISIVCELSRAAYKENNVEYTTKTMNKYIYSENKDDRWF